MQQDDALPPGKCIVRPPQMAGDSAVVGFHQYCHTFGAECNFSTETRAAADRGAHARLNSGASTDRKHPLRPVGALELNPAIHGRDSWPATHGRLLMAGYSWPGLMAGIHGRLLMAGIHGRLLMAGIHGAGLVPPHILGVIQVGGMDAPPRVEPPGRYEKCVETHYITGGHPVWQLGFSRFLVVDTGFQPAGEILPPA